MFLYSVCMWSMLLPSRIKVQVQLVSSADNALCTAFTWLILQRTKIKWNDWCVTMFDPGSESNSLWGRSHFAPVCFDFTQAHLVPKSLSYFSEGSRRSWRKLRAESQGDGSVHSFTESVMNAKVFFWYYSASQPLKGLGAWWRLGCWW